MSRERVVFDRITGEPGKMREPCIRGHRFTVAHLVRLVGAGMDVEQIQQDFPFIEAEDVRQALLYAADHLESATVPRDAI
jgi:uncharacterized protein (DUF433 family)